MNGNAVSNRNMLMAAASSSQSSLPAGQEVKAIMKRLRLLCARRSATRANDLASRFTDALGGFRSSRGRPSHKAVGHVSAALDEFIGEARSCVELVALVSIDELSMLEARVEPHLAALNQIFIASEAALHVGAMTPASFMLGAEAVVSNAVRELRNAHAMDNAGDASQREPGAMDGRRRVH